MTPPTDWGRVYETLDRIAEYRPEYAHDEFERASRTALAAAFAATQELQRADHRVPDDVFMTPDGGVMFLWAAADGSHEYYDFPPDGPPQRMTTFADGRPAVFTTLAKETT